MRASARRRLLIATIGSMLLSGCILFPPIFPPGGFVPGEGDLVVENATNDDWVLDLNGTFPMSYAVGAGETGSVPVLADTEMELVLRAAEDCEEAGRLEWDGSAVALRIDAAGTMTALDAAPGDPARVFVDYYNCMEGAWVPPEPGNPLPEAGGRILVVSNDSAPYELDVVEATVGPLAPDPEVAGTWSFDSYHVWSPDGRQLAFSREEGLEEDGIYVAAADGTNPELVAAGGRVPHWSPDGARIAYTVADAFEGDSRLEVLALATGEVTELATGAFDASWSPDGSHLAVITGTMTDPYFPEDAELRLVNADGSGLRTLAEAIPFAPAPTWSPDGSQIAFTAPSESGSFLGSDSVVAVHDLASGQTEVLVSVDGQSASEPAWSPNGEAIAVVLTERLGTSGSVALVDAASGRLDELHRTAETYYATPFWSPDGGWLAFTRTTGSSFAASLIAIRPDGSGEAVLATRMLVATQWIAGLDPSSP